MKILLILPAAEHVRVTTARPRVPSRAMLRFSLLPLTTVAALTPPGHDIRILDENVEPLDFECDVDLVGITFMTALAPRAYEIAAGFRARGKTVVAGGYHATLCPDEAAHHFDAIVAGDAEGAWEQLVRDAEAGCLRKVYSAPAAGLHSPVPRRDLLQRTRRHYVTVNAVQTGRGCRHACRYCSIAAFHERTCRHRPLAEVMAELRALPRDFIFVDDNIITAPDYARELFRSMIPLHKRWVAQCSLEIADDPEMLRLARAAGCCGLFIGIETESAPNLAAMGKAFNDSPRYAARIAAIRRCGIGIVAGMIVGLDADGPDVFERCLRFLRRTRIDAVQVNILTPLPGTPLFRDMQAAGRLEDPDWTRYDFRHVVFRPARMAARDLQDGADWLYGQFYRLDRILLRFARTLFTVGWIPAWLGLKLNLTYRYDNRRERIRGRNPAAHAGASSAAPRLRSEAST